VAIVVALVDGAVVIAAIIVRTPARNAAARISAAHHHIERTPHAEYIERPCTCDGS